MKMTSKVEGTRSTNLTTTEEATKFDENHCMLRLNAPIRFLRQGKKKVQWGGNENDFQRRRHKVPKPDHNGRSHQ